MGNRESCFLLQAALLQRPKCHCDAQIDQGYKLWESRNFSSTSTELREGLIFLSKGVELFAVHLSFGSILTVQNYTCITSYWNYFVPMINFRKVFERKECGVNLAKIDFFFFLLLFLHAKREPLVKQSKTVHCGV